MDNTQEIRKENLLLAQSVFSYVGCISISLHLLYLIITVSTIYPLVLPYVLVPLFSLSPSFVSTLICQQLCAILFYFYKNSQLRQLPIVGSVMWAIGGTGLGLLCFFYLKNNYVPGDHDVGRFFSAKKQMILLNLLVLCFGDGFFFCFERWFSGKRKLVQVLGIFCLTILETGSILSYVLQVIYEYRKYQQERSRVAAVNTT